MLTQTQDFVFTSPDADHKPYTEGKTSIKIPKGHLLTPHWHPNSNEITTCMEGTGTVTIIRPNPASPGDPGKAIHQTFEFSKGQVVFLPQGFFHYFVNTGDGPFVIDLTFDNAAFDILTLNEMVSLLGENIKVTSLVSDPANPVIPYV